jgi:hypothetical protein
MSSVTLETGLRMISSISGLKIFQTHLKILAIGSQLTLLIFGQKTLLTSGKKTLSTFGPKTYQTESKPL